MTWYVVSVRPQAELAVFSRLEHLVEAYLPLERVRVSRGHGQHRRAVDVDRPLIPGYLFIAVEDEHGPWRDIAETPGVITVLTAGPEGLPQAVPEAVMCALREAEALLAEQAASRARPRRRRRDDVLSFLRSSRPENRAEAFIELLNQRPGGVTLKLAELSG